MERRTVIVSCDWCGKDISPEPDLWDKQGGPVFIKFAAYEQRMNLCSVCLNTPIKVNDLREAGTRHLQGALPTDEALAYLPFVGDQKKKRSRAKKTPPAPEGGGE